MFVVCQVRFIANNHDISVYVVRTGLAAVSLPAFDLQHLKACITDTNRNTITVTTTITYLKVKNQIQMTTEVKGYGMTPPQIPTPTNLHSMKAMTMINNTHKETRDAEKEMSGV